MTHDAAPPPSPSDDLLRLVVARPEGAQQLRRALATLAASDPVRHGFQLTRLAYFANLLLTHGQQRGTHDDPCEVSREVISICDHGLEQQREFDPLRLGQLAAGSSPPEQRKFVYNALS